MRGGPLIATVILFGINEEVVSLSLTCYGSLFAACHSAVSRSWRRTLPFSFTMNLSRC
jgi:hypothetical protein